MSPKKLAATKRKARKAEPKKKQKGAVEEDSKTKPVISSESIKEVAAPALTAPSGPPVISTASIPDRPTKGPMDNEVAPIEITLGKVARPKRRRNELGKCTRKVYKIFDMTANHDLEILFDDDTIYVVEFRKGMAKIPQRVAEFFQNNYPRHRFMVE